MLNEKSLIYEAWKQSEFFYKTQIKSSLKIKNFSLLLTKTAVQWSFSKGNRKLTLSENSNSAAGVESKGAADYAQKHKKY